MFAGNALALLAAAAGAVAAATNGTVVTTTQVVSVYTTYCPAATTLTFNNKKYTVTAATTLTITDCPCTIVKPCYTCNVVVPPTGTPKPTAPPAKPTQVVVAGAARGQAAGYLAAAGVAAAGLIL